MYTSIHIPSFIIIALFLSLLLPQNSFAVQQSANTIEVHQNANQSIWSFKTGQLIKRWIDKKAALDSTKKARLYGIITALSVLVGVIFLAVNVPILVSLGFILLIVATGTFIMTIYYGNLSYYKDADKDQKYQFVKITALAITGFLVAISNILYFEFRRR